jgi:hypothetical protein
MYALIDRTHAVFAIGAIRPCRTNSNNFSGINRDRSNSRGNNLHQIF